MSKDNLRFETKQLHVGQEITDPTGARAVPITRQQLMYLIIVIMRQHVLD